MHKLRSCFFYCLLILFSKFTVAQTPAYKHYDVNNGLPTNEVYEIKQDRKGFLWIGCDAGLVRYDGNEFKLLSNKKNRGPAITGLREDKTGKIWCTNFSGQIFFTDGETLQLFEPWEKNYKNNYAEIALDKNDNLYVTNFENKIYRYNLKNKTEEVIVNDNELKQAPFTSYDGSVIYTSLNESKVKKITETGPLTVYKTDEKGAIIPAPVLNNFVFYHSNETKQTLGFQRFTNAEKRPSLYNYLNGKLVLHPVSNLLQKLTVFPSSCFDDDQGNLFIGSLNGLYWFKKSINGQWSLFNTSLEGNGISYIYQDEEGGLWIATLKNGIYKISSKDIWTIPQINLKTRAAAINHLATDGSSFIFGAAISGEIFGFNTKNKQTQFITNPETRDAQALEYNKFTNELFISKTGTYVYSFDKRTGTNISTVSSNAKDYYFSKEGTVYSTGTGVTINFPSSNTKEKEKLLSEYDTLYVPIFAYKYYTLERLSLFSQRTKGIFLQEKKNVLWVGFVDGLVYHENRKLQKFNDPVTKQPITAIGFAETADGTLYAATVEQGVYAIKDKKVIDHFTMAKGLLSDRIKRIHLYKDQLWIICGGAVQAYDLKAHTIKTINTTSGLLSSEIFDIETLHDTVYVATANGIQFFPANIITKNNVPPISIISEMQADDKSFSSTQKAILAYGTNNIVFHLQGIALKSDGKFIYEYRLLPSETNWIKVTANENIIRFSALSPGNYTFQSRVINEDGVVSKDKSAVAFTIKKPWWFQWWFLLLAFFVIAFLLYALFKYRLKKNQKNLKQQLEKSKVQEELRQSQLVSLKAQMNPHFMFNALNSIQEFILTNEKRQANMYMGKFADLMRMTLDMSNKKEIDLDDEIKILELYLQLEALRFEENFNYKISVGKNVNTIDIKLPSMLIQPYVENAVKHGLLHQQGEKKLTVVFDTDIVGTLTCTITDNGIGRKRSGEINQMRQSRYTSFATGATQKRLELLNYERNAAIAVVYNDLQVGNGNVVGTSVTIKIPV